MPDRSEPLPRWTLPGLLLLLLLTRAWFLLGSIEETVVNDELVTGVTWSWLTGTKLLGVDALWNARVGGDALYQLLALPLYALLGNSVLVPKLLALIVVAAGMVLVVHVAQRHARRSAALWAGLLYVLVPPGFMAIQLIGVGDHYVVAMAALLAGHLLLLALRAEAAPRRDRLLLSLGFVVGLGTFASYLNAVTWAALAPLLLLVRPRERWGLRSLLCGAAGLAIGLAPLVATMAWQGSASTTIYERSLADQVGMAPLAALGRAGSLLGVDLPAATWFRPGLFGLIGPWVWFLPLAVAALACAWWQRRAVGAMLATPVRRRRAPADQPGLALYLWLTVFAFTGAWSLSEFDFEPTRPFGYRYLVVLLPPLLLFGAIALDRIGRRVPGLAIGLGALPLLAGLFGLAWPASLHDPGRVLRYPGVTWTNHDTRAWDRWQHDPAEPLATRVPLLEPELRSGFLASLGAHAVRFEPVQDVLALGATSLSDEDRVHFYRGALKDLSKDGSAPSQGALQQLEAIARVTPEPSRDLVQARLSGPVAGWRGNSRDLGRWLEGAAERETGWVAPLVAEAMGGALASRGDLDALAPAIQALPDKAWRERAWFGAGYRWAKLGSRDLHALVGEARGLTPPHDALFLAGCARAVGGWPEVMEDPASWVDAAASEPSPASELFLSEIGAAAVIPMIHSPYRLADRLKDAAPPEATPSLCEGLGTGTGLYAKTLSDALRWRIDWSRFLGPGCNQAFDRGLAAAMGTLYTSAPTFHDRRYRGLGMSEPGAAAVD